MSTANIGQVGATGALHMNVIRAARNTGVPARELSWREILRYGLPQRGLSEEVNGWRLRNAPNLWRGARRVLAARQLKIAHVYGQLSLVVMRASGETVDYGLASLRVVTDTGVAFIVDAFQNSVELENLKYHGIGTGGTAEAAGQTALVTELTTEYNPNSTRATGSTTESAANIYRTVGTNTVDATAAITEHGIFSQAATGGGTMLDRSLFSVVNLASGDSLQTTYDLTLTSGG
jgi:hypothetical protein